MTEEISSVPPVPTPPAPLAPAESVEPSPITAPALEETSDSSVSNEIPAADTVQNPVAPAVPLQDQNQFLEGDVWTSQSRSFRIDYIAPEGGVTIRFRTNQEGGSSLFDKMKELFRSGNEPEGEWLFGSIRELEQFVAEGGYSLEKRGGKEEV